MPLHNPWNRDKRRKLQDPYYAGKSSKKLRKGDYENQVGPVTRGGDGRRDRDSIGFLDIFMPGRRRQNRGFGPPGFGGGMLPGRGFYDGEDDYRRKHRKLEETWGLRGRSVETGYMHGRGRLPPEMHGYPPMPSLPRFQSTRPHRSRMPGFHRRKEHIRRHWEPRDHSPMRPPPHRQYPPGPRHTSYPPYSPQHDPRDHRPRRPGYPPPFYDGHHNISDTDISIFDSYPSTLGGWSEDESDDGLEWDSGYDSDEGGYFEGPREWDYQHDRHPWDSRHGSTASLLGRFAPHSRPRARHY